MVEIVLKAFVQSARGARRSENVNNYVANEGTFVDG